MKIRWSAIALFAMIVGMGVHAKDDVSPPTLTRDALAELEESNDIYVQEAEEKKAYLSKMKSNAAQYGYQHGYATQMQYMYDKMITNKTFWNGLFDFSQITSLLSQGAARGMYLIGGVVDEVDASITTVDENLLLGEGKKYILRRKPSLRISPPHWMDYLFPTSFKPAELPRRDILPKTDEEREIWRKGTQVGWDDGSQVAYNEFRKRYTLLFADLTGMVRYWRLVESGLILDVEVTATNHQLVHKKNEDSEELIFDPTSIQITAQSTFSAKPKDWSSTSYQGSDRNASNTVRDAVIMGNIDLDEIMNSDITILTPEHQATLEGISNEQFTNY